MVKVHLDKGEREVIARIHDDYASAREEWETDHRHDFDEWLRLELPQAEPIGPVDTQRELRRKALAFPSFAAGGGRPSDACGACGRERDNRLRRIGVPWPSS